MSLYGFALLFWLTVPAAAEEGEPGIYCWGDGTYGQLGGRSVQLAPMLARGGDFVQVAAGDRHVCGLLSNGTATCWGSVSDMPPNDSEAIMRPADAPTDLVFSSIAAGMYITCGVLASNSSAVCWGDDSNGMLGDGGSVDWGGPVAIAGNRTFNALSVGTDTACGVLRDNSAVCWGTPTFGWMMGVKDTPTRVNGRFGQVTVGREAACGINPWAPPGNKTLCWGWNDAGQLGIGVSGDQLHSSQDPLVVSGGHDFRQLSATWQRACGLTPTGAAFCWGANAEGQLGDGSTAGSSSPVAVAGDHKLVQITAGSSATCALDCNGTAFCWGAGNLGQLGNGATEGSLVPVKVQTRLTFSQLSAGNTFVCGLLGTPPLQSFCPARPAAAAPTPQAGSSPQGGQAASNASAPSSGSSGGGGSSSAGIIAGAVAGVVGAALASGAIWWCCRARQRKRSLPIRKGEGTVSSKLQSSELDGTPSSTSMLPSASSPLELSTVDPLLASIASKLELALALPQPSAPSSDAAVRGSGSLPPLDIAGAYSIPFSELHFQKRIGEGSFAKVYLASWHETDVAVKLLLAPAASLASQSPQEAALALHSPQLAHLQAEAALMASLRHPNVLGFMGVVLCPPSIVAEYCPRGSLFSCLREARSSPGPPQLDWLRCLRIAEDAARGMLYLHSRSPPIVHRDLKSPNILLTDAFGAKIADFGLGKILEEVGVDAATVTSSQVVTNPRWLAPEVLAGARPSPAADVYSFGAILWELLTWQVPWSNVANPWQIARAVMDGARPPLPDAGRLPAAYTGVGGAGPPGFTAYTELISCCWSQQPEDRPTFQQVAADLRRLAQLVAKDSGRVPAPLTPGGSTRGPGDLQLQGS